MKRGVVLDVDDTLYLERDYVRSGFRAVDLWCRESLGVAGVGDKAWALFEQGVRGTNLGDSLASMGVTLSEPLLKRVVECYRCHRPDICLCRDAAEFFDMSSGSTLFAVVTDGPAQSQESKCAALGLNRWCDPIIVTQELGTSKPDPAVFRQANSSWNLSPNLLTYIGDNPAKDFQGPMQLGWSCFRVRRPGSLHYELPTPHGVDEICGLDEVL